MGKLIRYFLLSVVIFLVGCQTGTGNQNAIDEKQKEFILSKVNDYQGLIKLYREKLNLKDDVKTRYSLAKYYYLVMDYESSRHYLLPLLATNPDEDTLLLDGKNLLEQGHIAEAMERVRCALKKNPENGDALNIQGILLAQQGDFLAAKTAFDKARTRFVNEDKVINNLAMLAIMQEDYATARDYLAPLYSRGYSSDSLLHNLVFTLVKMRDFSGAEAILRREKAFDVSDGLLESLSQIKPRSQQQLQQLELSKNQDVSMRKSKNNEKIALASSSSEEHKNEIVAVRIGQHKKYFRIAMASLSKINFKELKSKDMNQRVYELSDVTMSDEILRMGNDLAVDENIKSIAFTHKDKKTILVKLFLKRKINKVNIFRIPAEKITQERLVFDVFMDKT